MDTRYAKPAVSQHNALIEAIRQDAFYSRVINSWAFQRLSGISFLGAIDYVTDWKLEQSHRTRFSHSLGVAALAKYVANARGYSRDTERHIVCAALLHDIGHLPLSHSAESTLKNRFGFGHHELAAKIIDGCFDLGESLAPVLKHHVEVDVVKQLISGDTSEVGGDLFGSKINVDTIDGINRANQYNHPEFDATFALQVAEAAFLGDDESRYAVLDQFWSLKHQVYADFIHSSIGLQADMTGQSFFENQVLDEEDLVADESRWGDQLTALFRSLSRNELRLRKKDTTYVSRDYFINDDVFSDDRYGLNKVENLVSLMLPRLPEINPR